MTYRRKHIAPKIRGVKKPKKLFIRRVLWMGVPLLSVLMMLGYFAFFFDGFQVSRIEVSGNQAISSEEIQALVWPMADKELIHAGLLNASSRSILLADGSEMRSGLLAAFPRIKQADVRRKFPQSIVITVQEREPFAVFCQSSSLAAPCFLIDREGIAFEEVFSFSDQQMVIEPADEVPVIFGEHAVGKDTMDRISQVAGNLENHFQLGVKRVVAGNPLVVQTSEGWKAYFDPTTDLAVQITKMNILLKDEIPMATRKNLRYIYLQYEDRAYYK